MIRLEALRRACEPAIRRAMHVYWWLARGMTLGVRALVVDETGRIFLVKHSYVSGWHLPGGGVEPGETLIDALVRELREEGNLEPTAPPVLHGMFFNDTLSPRNQIVAPGFFALDQLPNDTTAPTRARIIEALAGAPVTERW